MLAKPILILLSVFAAAGPALGMTVFTIKAGVVSGRKGPISLYVTDAGGRPAVPSRLDMGGATAPLTWVDFNANPFKFDVMLDGKLWSKCWMKGKAIESNTFSFSNERGDDLPVSIGACGPRSGVEVRCDKKLCSEGW